MRQIIIIALTLLASSGLCAQDYYTPGEGEGIVYMLPKTQVVVDIIATRVDFTPGEFGLYANRYLRLTNVSTQPETYWEIKDVKVRTVGIPDSAKAYVMKLKDRNMASNIELTDQGIVKAINTTSTYKENTPMYELEKPGKHENARIYMTEDILSVGSTAKMAELTAQEIYNIRDSKNTILRGQAEAMPKDGASLKLVIDQLDKQERALTECFTGTTDRTDEVFTFTVMPEDSLKEKVVARFSKRLGVLPPDNLAGDPVYISISSLPVLPALDESGKKKKKIDGIIYNVPGKGRTNISFLGKTMWEDDLQFTQFGYTEVLVNGLFDKKVNTRVIFNPTTGCVLKIDKN